MTRPRDLAIALSLANICFLEAWAHLVGLPGALEGRAPAGIDFAGIMVAVGVTAAAFFSGARVARRLGGVWLAGARLLVVMALAIPVGAFIRTKYESCGVACFAAFLREYRITLTFGCVVLLAGVLLFRGVLWRVIRSLLLFALPFVVITFGQAVVGMVRAPWLPMTPPLGLPPPAGAHPTARVVWLIFDELDERILFRERPSSLNAAEFDRLRASALSADNAYPPGPETIISIPGLMTGRLFKSVGFDRQGLRFEAPGAGTLGWDELPTVFARARAAGHDVRALGWVFPYCNLLAPQLSFCMYRPPYFGIYSHDPSPTLIRSAAAYLASLLPWNQHRLHLRDFTELLGAAREVVGDARPGLVYVHLPVPHPPPIFDRSTGQTTVFNFADINGYFDNVALADRTLGEIRGAMEATGAWDRSTIIVSSDHFWRDSKRLEGRGDHRIPFLLKPADSHAALVYANPFNTVLTGDIVLAILNGDITDVEAAAAWLDAHRTTADYPYYDSAAH